MFDPKILYDKPRGSAIAGRSTRTWDNWRKRGLIPEPDVMLGGNRPAWWGATLNKSPAFARPEQAA